MKASTATGSVERFIRTIVQVAIAASASFPLLVNTFHISPTLVAKITGVVSGVILAVTAVQNALEGKGAIPAMLRYVPPTEPPTPVTATLSVSGPANP